LVVTVGAGAVVLASALVVSIRVAAAGSSDLQGEREAIVYHGITACGVERWAIKVRRVGALYDCLTEAKSSRGG
jgi:hypothetical protein